MSSKEDNDQKEHKAIVGDYEVYEFDGETTLFYIEEKLQNRKWQDNDGFNGTMKMLDSRTDTPEQQPQQSENDIDDDNIPF